MSAGEQQADLTVQLGTSPSPWQFYYDSCHPVKGYVPVDDGQVSIYYEVHGLEPNRLLDEAQADRPKVVMIMGLACGCSGWRWQLQDLVQQHQMTPDFLGHPASLGDQQQQQQQQQQYLQQAQQQWQQQHSLLQQQAGLAREQQQQQQMLVCVLDNRGVGRSSSPRDPAAYSTSIMAQDVLAVMAHLKWSSAHILGFSMGGMIAQALAAAAPRRVASLTLLSTSAGGWQILPHSWSGLRTALKMVTARSPEDAADATLHMHFRRRTLKTWVTHLAARRQELLRREYMQPDDAPPQPPHGFKGQLAACWKHRLSSRDVEAINGAGFPVLVIHGRSDKLASAANAEALARRLSAPCVILPGAHFIVRECAAQINMLLSNLVFGRQHLMAPSNAPYMDPSPSLQKVWFKADSLPTTVAQAGAGVQQGSGQQQAWPGRAAAAANTSGRQ